MKTEILTGKKGGISKWFLIPLIFLLTLTGRAQDDTLKVMAYNLLQYPGSTIGRADNYLKDILKYLAPDILIVNELTDATGANYILSNALNVNGVTHYAKATYTGNNSLNNLAYYNSDKLVLASEDVINTTPRETDGYRFYYKDPNLSFHQDTVFITVYAAHLKAGQGYESDRNAAAVTIRNYLDNKSAVENHFLMGDFNLYNSAEAAYLTLLDTGNCQFKDPLNAPGIWHANSDFEDIHTQSTRTASFGGGATGGLDDRFDFILCTNDLLLGSSRVTYVPGSYISVGNDGNHFNKALISSPTNTLYPDSLVQDLYYMSDHLPVLAEFAVDLPAGPVAGAGFCADLFFSEYLEGTGQNRAIELLNPTSSSIDLSDYRLEFYPDGQTTLTGGHTLSLSGAVGAGSVFVVAGAGAGSVVLNEADQVSSLLDSLMTGNDAVALVNTSTGDTLDIIGRIGEDPGTSGWIVNTGATSNYTLVREYYIQKGEPNWTASSGHWKVYNTDFTDSLGQHSYYPCGAESSCTELFISEYIRGSGGNTAVEVYNPSSHPVILDGNYTLRLYTNGSSTSYYETVLDGIVYPDSVFVIAPYTASWQGILDHKDQTDASFPGALFFTGDDALTLFKGFDTLDVIGVIGEDPGSSWAVSGTNGVNGSTSGYTLVRDSTVNTGQLDWSAGSVSEWMVYSATDAYIGTHEMQDCEEEGPFKVFADLSFEEAGKLGMNVFPNPASEALTVDIDFPRYKENEKIRLSIINSAGIEIHNQAWNPENSKVDIDLTAWPNGLYVVLVEFGSSERITRKIVVIH